MQMPSKGGRTVHLLILSCNIGGGHNAAARAIGARFALRGHTWQMVNALSFMPRTTESFVSRGHNFAYRNVAKPFGAAYDMLDQHPTKMIHKLIYPYAKHLAAYLKDHPCDAIVCTHLFPAIMATKLRQKGQLSTPVWFVATDYTCSPGVGMLDLTGIFIPHALLADEFAQAGLPREKLIPTGIPVADRFYREGDREAARRLLGLPLAGPMVLMTSGSMGAGPVYEIAEVLTRTMPRDAFLTVICGSNEKLLDELRPLEARGCLRAVGYTDQMNDYMDAADLMLLKAGGLSTTEAAAKGMPFVYMDAVPGLEERNIRFMTEHGFALAGTDAMTAAALTCGCLENPAMARDMVAARGDFFRQSAADAICDTVEKTVSER